MNKILEQQYCKNMCFEINYYLGGLMQFRKSGCHAEKGEGPVFECLQAEEMRWTFCQ